MLCNTLQIKKPVSRWVIYTRNIPKWYSTHQPICWTNSQECKRMTSSDINEYNFCAFFTFFFFHQSSFSQFYHLYFISYELYLTYLTLSLFDLSHFSLFHSKFSPPFCVIIFIFTPPSRPRLFTDFACIYVVTDQS